MFVDSLVRLGFLPELGEKQPRKNNARYETEVHTSGDR